MNEKDEIMKEVMKQIKELPEEVRRAIYWFLENKDIVKEIALGDKMTMEEIKKFTEKALEKNDYIMLIMVLYKQVSDQKERDIQT